MSEGKRVYKPGEGRYWTKEERDRGQFCKWSDRRVTLQVQHDQRRTFPATVVCPNCGRRVVPLFGERYTEHYSYPTHYVPGKEPIAERQAVPRKRNNPVTLDSDAEPGF